MMKNQISYTFQNNIPIIAETDVLVVGGGPGGFGAGVMAAKQGVKVVLAERYGAPGGMATFGEVTPFMPNHTEKQSMDKPVFTAWRKRMWEYFSSQEKEEHPFNSEELAPYLSKDIAILAMEDLLLEAGVKIFYHHTLFDVKKENGKITEAIFHSKSGLCAIRAKIFIDATGDGDLAALAGCEVETGNDEGLCQPMTTCFKIDHIDPAGKPSWEGINAIYKKCKEEGKIDCLRQSILGFNTLHNDSLHFNTTRVVKKNATDGVELSEAEIEGRKEVRKFIAFLRENVPGFENARLQSLAHHIGVRESRRIRGIVYQTSEDFFNRAKYDDGIARINYPIDIHNPAGGGTVMKYMERSQWYEIRYGTLVPLKSENLLMGCRAISLDHALHSSARIMPAVCSFGQAAGMAAAMCVKENVVPASLDGKKVREALKNEGAFL
ncbi:MAG: FAD-dependent oxidoreductase [Lentisphaeria bacterium]|nr:FAD-dependent oxidoreductase [Lentisphaeria bacterium]